MLSRHDESNNNHVEPSLTTFTEHRSNTFILFIFLLLMGVGNDNNLQQQLRIVRDLRKIQNDDAVIVASCSSSLDLL